MVVWLPFLIPFIAHDRPIKMSIYSGLSIVMAIHQGVCRETAILLGDSWLKTHICRRENQKTPWENHRLSARRAISSWLSWFVSRLTVGFLVVHGGHDKTISRVMEVHSWMVYFMEHQYPMCFLFWETSIAGWFFIFGCSMLSWGSPHFYETDPLPMLWWLWAPNFVLQPVGNIPINTPPHPSPGHRVSAGCAQTPPFTHWKIRKTSPK